MFGFFKGKSSASPPIDAEMRLWMENAFLWLATQFGHDNIATKTMLLPTPEAFPISYDGSKESLIKTAEIVAHQFELDIKEINLAIYDQGIQEVGNNFGHRVWTEVENSDKHSLSAGLFFDKDHNGKYDILIERKNLTDPLALVAVLAHEFSHIKILGEKRLQFNDEMLTDLATVVFGAGIFNANSSFREIKTQDSYGYSSSGYFQQKEWGYALALYVYFRAEENSDWIKYLTPNIKADFKKSMEYIKGNTDKVFIEKYTG